MSKRNTRQAALYAEGFSWECFRFAGERQWKQKAPVYRAYFIKAASAANPDGTGITIGVDTFSKAGGKRRTAFNRLDDMAAMGAMLPELHTGARGVVREKLGPHGTKVRRLRFAPLEAAQAIIDSGKEFLGHARLNEEQQRAIQLDWMAEADKSSEEEGPKPCEEVQNSGVKESRTELSRSAELRLKTAELGSRSAELGVKECNHTLHTTVKQPKTQTEEHTGNSGAANIVSLDSKNMGQEAEELVTFMITTARLVDDSARGFYKKYKDELRETIIKLRPSRESLERFVRKEIGSMEEFELKNAGSNLAGVMEGELAAEIKRRAEAEKLKRAEEAAVAASRAKWEKEDAERERERAETPTLSADDLFGPTV